MKEAKETSKGNGEVIREGFLEERTTGACILEDE